jgi:hypothetical protein
VRAFGVLGGGGDDLVSVTRGMDWMDWMDDTRWSSGPLVVED